MTNTNYPIDIRDYYSRCPHCEALIKVVLFENSQDFWYHSDAIMMCKIRIEPK